MPRSGYCEHRPTHASWLPACAFLTPWPPTWLRKWLASGVLGRLLLSRERGTAGLGRYISYPAGWREHGKGRLSSGRGAEAPLLLGRSSGCGCGCVGLKSARHGKALLRGQPVFQPSRQCGRKVWMVSSAQEAVFGATC